MPLCSCSVVPVVAEMRRKGASRSACMSFLITAPETGADSILITQVFFGWIVAIIRPLISFITAVIAGMACFRLRHDDVVAQEPILDACCSNDSSKSQPDLVATEFEDDCCKHGNQGHEALIPNSDDCYIGFTTLKEVSRDWWNTALARFRMRPTPQPTSVSSLGSQDAEPLTLMKVAKHVFLYGFVDIADDILLALIFGIALSGLLYLAIPSELMNHEYARLISYPVMILVAVPLYVCASASTPIAATLVAKGFSPGAALIFLMTGPATNTSTIAIVLSQFGSKFTTIYVGVVIAVTVALGIAIDVVLFGVGYSIVVNLETSHEHVIQVIQYSCTFLFIGLIVWRSRAGALKSGWHELLGNLRVS